MMEAVNVFSTFLFPVLYSLLDLIAIVLAIIFYRRSPGACLLVIVAAVVNILVSLVRGAFQMWMLRDMEPQLIGYVFMGFSAVNWVAYALMIVAVFVGRHAPTPYRRDRDVDRDWDRPAPARKAGDGTGIQEQP
jgi:hypothetical protein